MTNDRLILANPVVFQGRHLPKNDHAFVIMPFRPKWSKIVWETVRSTMIDLKFKCIRADEQFGQQILEDIWQGIYEAAIIIADVTGRNPSVYYELGLAHVLGRRVILLTQNMDDIPFDTLTYRHIPYKSPIQSRNRKREMLRLSEELKKHVKWITENEILPTSGRFADAYNALRKVRA